LNDWQNNSQLITLPHSGYRVFTKDLGDSTATSQRTLLLLHGFPESSFSFNKVVAGLQQQFDRVVLLDMLGYGFSDKPDTVYSYSLIEQADAALRMWRVLGISGGHILSHDMGTSVLTELVSRQVNEMLPAWFPSGFHNFTFTNGSMVLGLAKLRVMQRLLLTRFGATIGQATSYRTFRSAVLSAHGADSASGHGLQESDVMGLWENVNLQDGQFKAHLTIRYLHDRRRFEESRWLSALGVAGKQTPVHICWGDADAVARIEMARYLKNTVCPDATLTVMPGVGHFCQLGSPELWLENVNAFYQQL